MASERVQKILAQAGIASRRKAEELITEGLVTINGKLAKLGDKADLEQDAIKVRGKLLRTKEAPVYLAFYKPRGVISTLSDPDNRPTIADFLHKVNARVFPVGRLDFNSEGLLLLTNDGEIAAKLQKLEGVPRVYHVKVRGKPDPEMVKRIEAGARIGSRMVRPQSVRLAQELQNKVRIEIVFTESGVVDVKSLFELKGFLVESIRRTALGHITLRGLEPGQYRILKASQVQALFDQPELGFRELEKQDSDEKFGYRIPSKRRDEEELPPGTERPKRFGDHFRFERPEHGDEKPQIVKRKSHARGERSERSDRGSWGERGERGERSERSARGPREERGWGKRSERSERSERGAREERGERSEHSWKSSRGGASYGSGGGKKPREERSWSPRGGESHRDERPSWGGRGARDENRNRNDRPPQKRFGATRRDESWGSPERSERGPGKKFGRNSEGRGGAGGSKKPSFRIRVRRKDERED